MERVAIVDNEDWPLLSRFKWIFRKNVYNDKGYAARYLPRGLYLPKQRQQMILVKMEEFIIPVKRYTTIDHINGDSLDNRKSNLRLANTVQQRQNRGHGQGFKGRRFKGVYRSHAKGTRWEAQIRVQGKLRQIGTFATEVEAAQAYNKAALEYFGAFASLNAIKP